MLRACLVALCFFSISALARAEAPKFSREGWTLPKPPYPRSAKLAGLEGAGGVSVVTDATGRVVIAKMAPSIHPQLDAICIAHAKKEWHGRPNVRAVIPVTFVLDTRKPPRR